MTSPVVGCVHVTSEYKHRSLSKFVCNRRRYV